MNPCQNIGNIEQQKTQAWEIARTSQWLIFLCLHSQQLTFQKPSVHSFITLSCQWCRTSVEEGQSIKENFSHLLWRRSEWQIPLQKHCWLSYSSPTPKEVFFFCIGMSWDCRSLHKNVPNILMCAKRQNMKTRVLSVMCEKLMYSLERLHQHWGQPQIRTREWVYYSHTPLSALAKPPTSCLNSETEQIF